MFSRLSCKFLMYCGFGVKCWCDFGAVVCQDITYLFAGPSWHGLSGTDGGCQPGEGEGEGGGEGEGKVRGGEG